MEGSARPGRRHRAGALAGVIAGVPGGVRVFLCTEPTDMRKSRACVIARAPIQTTVSAPEFDTNARKPLISLGSEI